MTTADEAETAEAPPPAKVSEPAAAPSSPPLGVKVAVAGVGAPRIVAIDVLRGFVMVLMSIDHASEVFNGGRFFSDSIMFFTPGTPIPAAQFFLRWITHLCAPTFVALAGTALAISTEGRKARGESAGAIDRHILVRGALILAFEFLWMSPVMRSPGNFLGQVLYAIGASLICMAVLRRLSDRALLAVGLLLAVGSEILIGFFAGADALDEIPVALTLSGGFFFDRHLIIAYPVLPWLALMCLGWVLGRRFVAWREAGKDAAQLGTRALTIFGVAGLVVFGVFRALNSFGNMRLLRESNDLTQWFHVSKYPPSLTFDGLELGIAALLLAALLRLGPRRVLEPFRLLGQTALFYYLLHIHLMQLVGWATHTEHKLGMPGAYLGGLLTAAALYPVCARYLRYKQAHPAGLTRFV